MCVFFAKHGYGGFQEPHLGQEVLLVPEQGVMDARAHKGVDQRLDDLPRNADFGFQQLCILCVPPGHTRKERSAVFAVLGGGVHLVHKAVLFAVFFRRPVGDLAQKTRYVLQIFGRFLHKILFHLCHAVCGGIDDDFVFALEIMKNIARTHPARFGKFLGGRSFQTVLAKAVKTFFQQFFSFMRVLPAHGLPL